MAKELLIYSSELAVLDTTLKRSVPRLAHQAKVKMEAENEELQRRIERREADNISCALPYIYGGATMVQRGENTQPAETIELESSNEDGNYASRAEEGVHEDYVFPYAITHKTNWPKLPKIAESSEQSREIVGRRRRRKNTRYKMTLRAQAEMGEVEEGTEDGRVSYEVIEEPEVDSSETREKRLSDDEIFRGIFNGSHDLPRQE